MLNAEFHKQPFTDNRYEVIYRGESIEKNLPKWVAKLLANTINEVTGQPALQVAANIWTAEMIIDLGYKMKIIITQPNAAQIIKKLNKLDSNYFSLNEKLIQQTIFHHYDDPDMKRQQAQLIWTLYNNQFINSENKFVEDFLGYPAGSNVGEFLSWFQGTFQLDTSKLNHQSFINFNQAAL